MSESKTKEYLDQFSEGIDGLKDIKKTIYDDIKGVKVFINKTDTSLVTSIEKVFGSRQNDADKDFITFDMFMHCLKIVRAGSKAKASEIIDKNI
jgi:uncharacterized protein (UPF0335 family)